MGKLYDIHFKNTTEASLSRGWLGDGGGLPVPVGAVAGFGLGLCQNLIKKEADFIEALSRLGRNT